MGENPSRVCYRGETEACAIPDSSVCNCEWLKRAESANHCLVGAGVVMKPLCPCSRPRPKNTVTEIMLEVFEL